jgi:hypothetical protein
MPLPNCNNEGVLFIFMDRVFNRVGALVEVFTNQATKICEEFHKLCERTLINHHTTS